MKPLGAILAGGRNSRYGSHKALAEVGGERIALRVRAALETVAEPVVLVANEPGVYASLGLPMRPDARAGLGPLGGIHTALLWARELDAPAVVAVACDMPFVPAELLRWLAAAARETGAGAAPDVVVPESTSRRGMEPLCALYTVRCLEAIEARADAGDLRMVGFFDDVLVRRLSLEQVRRLGDPEVLFMNVNTPDERARADALAAGMEER